MPQLPQCIVALTVIVAAFLSTAHADQPESQTVKLIDQTIDKLSDASTQRLIQLQQLADQVLQHEPDNVLVQQRLKEAQQKASGKQPGEAAGILEAAIAQAKATLAFKPLREAKLPKGFPEPTDVGVVRVKEYPAYRLARTEMKGKQNGAFMVLFNHIKKNDIAMTAPVEMTYGESKSERPKSKSMAFLYGSTEIGKAEKQGQVEVVDVPAMTTVSLGLRGDYTDKQVAEAREHLEAWLSEHADQYEAAGELRVMGYNSPMVPSAVRYSEVEIPVVEK